MNEGHSAFLTVERIAEMVRGGMDFEQAAEAVRKTTVFTTHTPVPAGSDLFPLWLADKYFEPVWPELKPIQRLIDLARQTQPWGESFSMPVLALRLAQHCNAVSELHGQVARQMWHFLWQDRDVEAVPIGHVTNGVHTCTWLARRMGVLFSRYLGADWLSRIDDPNLWAQVQNIPDGELWAVRKHLKRALTTFANERARKQWMLGRIHPVQVIAGGVLLEPSSLTIGFARRFATYKQASLVLRDYQRLLRIINNPRMPVQIIFSGKAHPADEPGKLLIQKVYRQVKDSKAAGRLVFLEDYDMKLARYLVQGVDVWLNTPRRLNEASGTSGMKAAINGGLNFSILDGWWHEAYNGTNGWAIGDQTESSDPNQQDDADAQSLYDVLENEIVPLYYRRRSADNLPVEWLARVKESIRTLTPQFSTQRMVKEYLQQLYLPALHSQPEGIPTEE
ncbi:MAG: alpha-glucan family phosphorylase, partial [Anaerolineaceae bacterium]|nr:alpha-glucan family phosphorylase [Anaerolineaceae bacterium]